MTVLESPRVLDANVASCGNRLEQHTSSLNGSENVGDNLVEDLDSYLEDINDRLTISRMVSDSVIRGMVSAVEQEAASKISIKELEVAKLRENLRFYHVGSDEVELSSSQLKHRFLGSGSDLLTEHDLMGETLGDLTVEVKSHFKKLKKEIDKMRGSSFKSGILPDKVSERWVDVDKTICSLKSSLENVCRHVDNMAHLSKASVPVCQQEQAFREEIEDMVIKNCIRSLQEEFEERIWDHNADFIRNEATIIEISNLRHELNTICKSLSIPDNSLLTSHGSMEIGEEWNNSKKTDQLHHKVLSNSGSSASHWEGNGKHDSESITAENVDRLKRMRTDDLISYFMTEITKMKRDHETDMHQMTEKYYSLKREYLREREYFKERGSSLQLKKDKDFDIFRKKIPEVILKLDDILTENEKLTTSSSAEYVSSLKDRLSTILSENRQLRDFLTDKKKEVKRLSAQVSDATEKASQHSLVEAKLLRLKGNLRGDAEDSNIEASIREEVYKCVLREVLCLVEYNCLELCTKSSPCAEDMCRCEIQDSDIESAIMQGLLEVIYREAIHDTEAKLSIMHAELMHKNEDCISFQRNLMEKERALTSEAEKKERLMLLLKEKEKSALEMVASLEKEQERFGLSNQEIITLRDDTNKQQSLISAGTKELDALKCKLFEAKEQIDLYKEMANKLNHQLQKATKELKETDEERKMLLDKLFLLEANDKEHTKQTESVIDFFHGLSEAIAEFECRVAGDIENKSLRVESINSQLSSLIQKAKILRRTGLLYKQKLEKRCSDLEKAEAEVDLLGNEVDTLVSLHEKIYIALDHYSPILQHYPGVMEILKLVRRELNRQSTKAV